MSIQLPLVAKQTAMASIAAAAAVTSTVINLGSNYMGGVMWVSKRGGVASPGESLALFFSENNVTWYPATNTTLDNVAANAVSAVDMDCAGRICGRYIKAVYMNGSTAQSATAVLRFYVQPDFN